MSFSIIIHHGGKFEVGENTGYNGGDIAVANVNDVDKWCFLEAVDIVRQLGYKEEVLLWWMSDSPDYIGGYKSLKVDRDALQCSDFAIKHNYDIHMYVESLVGEKIDGDSSGKGLEEETEGATEADDAAEQVPDAAAQQVPDAASQQVPNAAASVVDSAAPVHIVAAPVVDSAAPVHIVAKVTGRSKQLGIRRKLPIKKGSAPTVTAVAATAPRVIAVAATAPGVIAEAATAHSSNVAADYGGDLTQESGRVRTSPRLTKSRVKKLFQN